MKIPFLQRVNTVDVHLKGGTVIRKDFLKFNWQYNGDDGIISLKWQTADGTPCFVNINSIEGIVVVKSKIRFRLRK